MTDSVDNKELAIITSLKYFYRVAEFYPTGWHSKKNCILCNPDLVSTDLIERIVFVLEHILKQHLSMPKKIIYEFKQQLLDMRQQCDYSKASTEYLSKPTEMLVKKYLAGNKGIRETIAEHVKLTWGHLLVSILIQHAPYIKLRPQGHLTEEEIKLLDKKIYAKVQEVLADFQANIPFKNAYPDISSESNVIEFLGHTERISELIIRPMRLTLTAFENKILEDARGLTRTQSSIG